jgi:glycosyltransferase involved in cell wall biosynthesis
MNTNPLISFIIPTHNSAAHIETLIKSIYRQPYKNIEIIISDNNSNDSTLDIARKYKVRTIICKGQPPQVAKQRNFGARIARGTYLYFMDHDMELCKNFISVFKEQIESRSGINTDAWYVPEKILSNDAILSIVRNFEAMFIDNTVVSAARLIKRKRFYEIDGYDENLSNGPADWDLDIQLKLKELTLRTLNTYIYHHEENLTIKTYIYKKTSYISGEDVYKRKWFLHPNIYKNIVVKQYSLYYRICGIFLENNKWKILLNNLDKYFIFISVKLSMALFYEYWRRRYEN